ncbi:hypothetical protein BSKO_02484 [Bryopsis sp. KO-2023]|nr:hypothetical protein BSKO_02484 [Bryopsis sp. KO-2023]
MAAKLGRRVTNENSRKRSEKERLLPAQQGTAKEMRREGDGVG